MLFLLLILESTYRSPPKKKRGRNQTCLERPSAEMTDLFNEIDKDLKEEKAHVTCPSPSTSPRTSARKKRRTIDEAILSRLAQLDKEIQKFKQQDNADFRFAAVWTCWLMSTWSINMEERWGCGWGWSLNFSWWILRESGLAWRNSDAFPLIVSVRTPLDSHWGEIRAKSGWVSAQPTLDWWPNQHIFPLPPPLQPSGIILSVSPFPPFSHPAFLNYSSTCLGVSFFSLQNSPLFQYLHDLGHTDFEACPTASQEEEYGGQEGDFTSPDEDSQKRSVSSSHHRHKYHTRLSFPLTWNMIKYIKHSTKICKKKFTK